MKIIDAHMHYFNVEGFVEVAKRAGYENTAACWQQICQDNNIAFSVAMGNTAYTSSRYGGVPPRFTASIIMFSVAINGISFMNL